MTLPKTILVPTDFSEFADHALDYAIALAARLDAKLHVVNAIGVPALGVPELGIALTSTTIESAVKRSQASLDALAVRHLPAKIEVLLRTGDARDIIVNTAIELGADLIVMGTHGRRGFKRALLGSVTESVIRHAPCAVLAVRRPDPGGR